MEDPARFKADPALHQARIVGFEGIEVDGTETIGLGHACAEARKRVDALVAAHQPIPKPNLRIRPPPHPVVALHTFVFKRPNAVLCVIEVYVVVDGAEADLEHPPAVGVAGRGGKHLAHAQPKLAAPSGHRDLGNVSFVVDDVALVVHQVRQQPNGVDVRPAPGRGLGVHVAVALGLQAGHQADLPERPELRRPIPLRRHGPKNQPQVRRPDRGIVEVTVGLGPSRQGKRRPHARPCQAFHAAKVRAIFAS